MDAVEEKDEVRSVLLAVVDVGPGRHLDAGRTHIAGDLLAVHMLSVIAFQEESMPLDEVMLEE